VTAPADAPGRGGHDTGPMTEHQSSIVVDLPADLVFAYLSDVENLPEYLPRMTQAHQTGEHDVEVTAQLPAGRAEGGGSDSDEGGDGPKEVGGTATWDVDEQSRQLRWGSEGDKDYGGRIGVEPQGDKACTVTVALRWHHGDPQDVDADLERSVRRIKVVVEERERPAAAQI
jgi:hypothetical protein